MIRCYKTKFFLWNTNNTDRNGVNKQTHRHTHQTLRERLHWKQLVSVKSDPPFLKQLPLFYQPLPFYGKKLKLPFYKSFENSNTPPLHKGWRVLTMFTLNNVFSILALLFSLIKEPRVIFYFIAQKKQEGDGVTIYKIYTLSFIEQRQ